MIKQKNKNTCQLNLEIEKILEQYLGELQQESGRKQRLLSRSDACRKKKGIGNEKKKNYPSQILNKLFGTLRKNGIGW